MSQRSREREDRRRRDRRLWLAGLVGLASVVLVAAGVVAFREGDPDGSIAGTRVALSEYAFDPDPIAIDAADPTLQVVNDGTIAHNLLVVEAGRGTPELDPGDSHTLELDGIDPGTYTVVCDLTGHREAGMATQLVVR